MKNYLYTVVVVCSLCLLSSCGTMFTGTSDIIHITSSPAGADVRINGIIYCQTPCPVTVDRAFGQKILSVSKEGYNMYSTPILRKFNTVAYLDILTFFGVFVDAYTGSLIKFDPKQYNIILQKPQ